VRAFARVVAEADRRGGTRLAVLHGESPLLPRRTGGRGGPGVTVHLVGGAAGPLRGDELRLELTVGAGAELTVRSVAAQLALPGRAGLPASRYAIRATVAAGGILRWLPEPLIAAAGCDHLTSTHVEVAEGGSVLWRDDLVCGRHGEAAGDVRIDVTIRYAGATLYRHELAIGPGAPGWAGPAVLGSSSPTRSVAGPDGQRATRSAAPMGSVAGPDDVPAPAGSVARLDDAPAPAGSPAGPGGGRAVGAVIFAGAGLPAARLLGGDAVLMPLAGPGMLATTIGDDIRQVRAALDPLCVPPTTAESPGAAESATAESPATAKSSALAHASR
jgi:urease accessory protein